MMKRNWVPTTFSKAIGPNHCFSHCLSQRKPLLSHKSWCCCVVLGMWDSYARVHALAWNLRQDVVPGSSPLRCPMGLNPQMFYRFLGCYHNLQRFLIFVELLKYLNYSNGRGTNPSLPSPFKITHITSTINLKLYRRKQEHPASSRFIFCSAKSPT